MKPLGLLLVSLALVISSHAHAQVFLDRLRVPSGFAISLYAQDIPYARSMSLSPSGVLYVASWRSGGIGGATEELTRVYAMLDDDDDGNIDPDELFPVTELLYVPNGMVVYDGSLYVAQVDQVHEWKDVDRYYRNGSRSFDATLIAPHSALPNRTCHGSRYLSAHNDKLYLAVGAPCNVPGDAAVDCLTAHPFFGTIIRMDRDGSNIEVVARGIRSSVGITFHPTTGDMWFTDNGRDKWDPQHHTRPADELNRLELKDIGADYGFPHCYGKNMPDPAFNPTSSCTPYRPAVAELDAHAAVLGVRFYAGAKAPAANDIQFPGGFRGNAFIAEHGSWNRQPPSGYQVTRVQFNENGEATSVSPFVSGWLDPVAHECMVDADCPGNARCQNPATGRPYDPPYYCSGWGRPGDIEILEDGSLLVSDELNGVIYRVTYVGEAPSARPGPDVGTAVSAAMLALVAIIAVVYFVYRRLHRSSDMDAASRSLLPYQNSLQSPAAIGAVKLERLTDSEMRGTSQR